MSEEALDELSVLSAIFCEKDEFELIEESVVSIYQKWSKERTVVNRRQGHGRPWITDACGEGSLACVVRSNRRTPVAQIVEELNAVNAWQNRSNTILAQTGLVYRICTPIDTDSGRKTVNLTFHLPLLYPQTPPDISVTSSDFSRTHCQELKRAMLSKAHSLPPEPMVHHLVTWLQSNIAGLIRTPDCSNTAEREAEDRWMALLHLDHMRSKAKYIKLIEKWTSELGLVGRLFVGRPILILLQGTKESIKEYIHLQRTVKVDVDSSGKRCKEKMLRVLCEVPFTVDFKRISTFEVKEDLSLDDLRREFDLVGSMKLYHKFVPLVQ